ncbi:MAG: putative collagen-binding domain-containing protein, partial [Bacteroidota bacterium]
FETYLPYWDMHPDHALVSVDSSYCFAEPGNIYALYIPNYTNASINLTGVMGSYDLYWYDPIKGGDLLKGSITSVDAGKEADLGLPPQNKANKDWVLLLRKL